VNWKSVSLVAAAVVLGEAIAWRVFHHSTIPLWLLILVAASVSVVGGDYSRTYSDRATTDVRAIDTTPIRTDTRGAAYNGTHAHARTFDR
jgi:hypothetical protein